MAQIDTASCKRQGKYATDRHRFLQEIGEICYRQTNIPRRETGNMLQIDKIPAKDKGNMPQILQTQIPTREWGNMLQIGSYKTVGGNATDRHRFLQESRGKKATDRHRCLQEIVEMCYRQTQIPIENGEICYRQTQIPERDRGNSPRIDTDSYKKVGKYATERHFQHINIHITRNTVQLKTFNKLR